MKTPLKVAHRAHTLGDLILAVSSHSRKNRETLAAVVDLIESGRVRFQVGKRSIRARVI